MQIGQIARSTGLSVDTIRFYEKQGLVHAPARSSGGYRVYEERDVERFQFVGRAQNLGFSLQEIRELLVIESRRGDGCSHVHDLIAAKIDQVKEKITELKRIESRLTKAQRQCSAALLKSCSAECPVLEALGAGTKRG
jgi:MerR family transcriptional regulator, copper efflux regulator